MTDEIKRQAELARQRIRDCQREVEVAQAELNVITTKCPHERAKGSRCPDCGKIIGWEPDPY